MANLLSWIGNVAKGIERQLDPFDNGATYSNPNPAPKVAPRPAPVAPTVQPRAQPFNLSSVTNVRPIIPAPSLQTAHPTILPTAIRPVGDALAGLVKGSGQIAGIGAEDARMIAALATRNKAALDAANQRATADVGQAVGVARSVPRAAAQLALSAKQALAPGAFNPAAGAYQPNNTVAKLLLGNEPLQSFSNVGNQTKQQTGSTGAAVTNVGLNALNDLLSLKGGIEATKKAESLVKGTPPLAGKNSNQVGAVGKNVTTKPKKEALAIVQATPVSKTKAMLESKVNVLHEIGKTAPSAHVLGDHMTAIDNLSQTLAANAKNRMPTTFSLSDQEFRNLGRVIENGRKPMNADVALAAKESRAVLADIHSAATKVGAVKGKLKNYFPRDYSNFKVGTSDFNTAAQHLVDSGQVKSLPQAVQILKNYGSGKGTKPSFFGNFDRSRLDVPGYRYTKDALQNYLNGAADKTAQATHFGAKGQVVNRLLAKIIKEGGDGNVARQAVENYLHSSSQSDALAPVRGAFAVSRLVKAPISHLGQSTNIPLITRGSDYAVGLAKRFTAEGKKIVGESDVNNPRNIHGLSSQEVGINGKLGKVTAVGLGPVQKFNRGVAAIAGDRYGQHLAATGDEASLRDLGVTGKISGKLTTVQRQQSARGIANQTMFTPSRASTPINAETPIGRTIGQYRLAYGYKQTSLVWNKVVKAAAGGNVKPLIKFLALSAPAAAGTVALKDKLTAGSDQGPGGVAATAAGNLTGLPGETAVSLARYGKTDAGLTKTVASTIAPLAGEGVDITQRLAKLRAGNAKPIEAYSAGLVPGIGKNISQKISPPPAGKPSISSTGALPANASPTEKKAQGTLEAKDLEKIAGNDTTLQKLSNGKYAYTLADGETTVHQVDNLKAAQKAIAEYSFKQSGDSYKTIGDTVYRKAADGSVTTMTKTAYQYKIGAATLVAQKSADDLDGWLKTAHGQLDSIAKQLQDPSIDPLDAITLQNEADTLQSNIDKYTSYGDFTKPKAAKKARSTSNSASTSSFKTAGSNKTPGIKGISVKKLAAPSFKSGGSKRIPVSRIPSNYLSRKLR